MLFKDVLIKTHTPVEELDDGEGGGVSCCSRGDPVQSFLPDVDEVKIFVTLQAKTTRTLDWCCVQGP